MRNLARGTLRIRADLALATALALALTGATLAMAPAPARADGLHEKLAHLRGPQSRRILFIDVDNTLGAQDEHSGRWMLYTGAVEFVREQLERGFLPVLFTANTRVNLDALFAQVPELRASVVADLTSEDFAPRFSALMRAVADELARTPNPSEQHWRQMLYEAWLASPASYLPEGVVIDPWPADAADWRKRVYIPYLRPDKTAIVAEFDAILVDDRCAEDQLDRQYTALAASHRGVFAGRVGGQTADSGPDYAEISRRVQEADRRLRQLAQAAERGGCDPRALATRPRAPVAEPAPGPGADEVSPTPSAPAAPAPPPTRSGR